MARSIKKGPYVFERLLKRVRALNESGKKEVLNIDIDPEIVDPDDIETLSDILVAAVNEAIKKVETIYNQEMEKITGGLGLPGGLF